MSIQEGVKIFEHGRYLNGSLELPVSLDGLEITQEVPRLRGREILTVQVYLLQLRTHMS